MVVVPTICAIPFLDLCDTIATAIINLPRVSWQWQTNVGRDGDLLTTAASAACSDYDYLIS